MDWEEIMEWTSSAFEVVGVAVIAIGGAIAIVQGLRYHSERDLFDDVRRRFGRPLLLGLEILVAADVIETITVDRSLESAASLGILVLVRTVLSVSLQVDLDGVAPWRKAELELAERRSSGSPSD